MKEQLDHLNTGVYRAHGFLRDVDATYGTLQGDVELFGVVDYPNGRQRFDRREPVRLKLDSESLKKAKGPAESWKQAMLSSKFIQTAKETTYYQEGSKSVVIRSPDSDVKTEGEPIDLRALGFMYWVDLRKGYTFPQYFEAWNKSKPVSVVKETDSIHCIIWEFPDSQRKFWINEATGFVPIKCEVRTLMSVDGKSGQKWSEPKLIIEITWALFNNIWVPKSYRIQDNFTSNSKDLSLSFDWESVNGNIAEEELTIQGFRLKNQTKVVDTKLGTPILTDILNDPVRHPEIFEGPPRTRRLYFLLSASLGFGFLLIIMLRLLIRRRQRNLTM